MTTETKLRESQTLPKMVSFKEFRELLLLLHANDLISHAEFIYFIYLFIHFAKDKLAGEISQN